MIDRAAKKGDHAKGGMLCIITLLLLILVTTIDASAQGASRPAAAPASVSTGEMDDTEREVMEQFAREAAAAESESAPVEAVDESRADMELRYADGLMALGLPDFADIVIKNLGAGPEIKQRRVQSLLQRGKFDEVLAQIKAEPDPEGLDAWAMRLALADGYYAWGKYKECQEVYDSFFKRFGDSVPENYKKFYIDAAYKYAQLLTLMGNRRGAIDAYRKCLAAKPERAIERQLMSDMCEQMLKLAEESKGEERSKLLAEVDEICNKILWVQDLWFGKAIVMKAHILILNGDLKGAMDMFNYYTEQLIAIDKSLAEKSTATDDMTRLSPMAQCRYLLGVILQTEAEKILREQGDTAKAAELLAGDKVRQRGKKPAPKKEEKPKPGEAGKKPAAPVKNVGESAGALQHFINVFVNYPNTPWATDAGRRFRQTKDILETQCGVTINFEVSPAQWETVQNAQLKNAKALFNNQLFEEAAESYGSVLSLFPESSSTVPALGDLAMCYVELDDDMFADTVVGYMCDRYGGSGPYSVPAGDTVLRIASTYADRKKKDRERQIQELFFSRFKNHPRTAALLYQFGAERIEAQDYAKALSYFQMIMDSQKNSSVYFPAYAKIAECQRLMGNPDEEINLLNKYIEEAKKLPRPGHDLLRGMYQLANAYRAKGDKYLANAINRYNEIIKALRERPNDFAGSETITKANQAIIEGSIFYKAYCYSKLPPPKDKPADTYKQAALQAYQQLLTDYPASMFSPACLNQIGALWTIFEKPQEADAAYTKLKTMYPDSPEAKNSDFSRAMTLLSLGLRDKAVAAFKEMFGAGAGKFRDTQILSAGQELSKAKEYDIALEAFEKVLGTSKDRTVIQTALLWKGRTLQEKGDNAGAAGALEELFKKYPRTGLTVEASRYLSRCYADLARNEADGDKRVEWYNKALDAIKRMQKYVQTPRERMSVAIEIGRMTEVKSETEKQYSAEKATEYRNEALVYYVTTIDFADTADPEILAPLESAFESCVRLFIESENWVQALEYAEKYLKLYSDGGKYAAKIRNWRGEARGKMTTATAAPAAPPAASP